MIGTSYLKEYTRRGIDRVRGYIEKVQEERKRKNREKTKEGIKSIISVLKEKEDLDTTFMESPVEAYKTLRKEAEEKEELLTRLRPKERSKREKMLIGKTWNVSRSHVEFLRLD